MAESYQLALLGDPVQHSRSPAMHNAALRTLGLAGGYEARRVDGEGMIAAALDVRQGRLDGANITMPHKQLALELADSLSPLALRAGAVNTWVRTENGIEGHNTDVAGVAHAWETGSFPSEAPVLVLGGGGAAAAACLALEHREVSVSARRFEAAVDLISRLCVEASPHIWDVPMTGAIVVNATPIGMHGEPLPDGMLAVAAGFFDMTYGAVPTPAVERAHILGIPTLDGREMLLGQAMASFTLWTGCEAPEAEMRHALGAEDTQTSR